ncbi:preprotein translocase subunit SecE [Candidatus Wolfebacteria bacterium CG03_land_8_20_14_0_80_40_12]|uniref:Protein translocase subunit SecE n=1 Tax=Candidatus Wolfebacteria bacterium CG03_land_8_20_14_0_80_40_12 TaxID=1975069 RepID=A0A2M7B566_9BACT|nr:MAG: preprotein translocase subunit SecE [Candidatus Wolfebacteria bacterium CG03_land_8_20_14_0_80_40_12]
MLNRLKSYIINSYHELHRVNWPTRKETVRLVLIVVGLSIGVAIFLGILDMVFVYLLERLMMQ